MKNIFLVLAIVCISLFCISLFKEKLPNKMRCKIEGGEWRPKQGSSGECITDVLLFGDQETSRVLFEGGESTNQ